MLLILQLYFFFTSCLLHTARQPIVYTIQKTLVCFSLDVSWFVLCERVCVCVSVVLTAGCVCRGRYTKCCCLFCLGNKFPVCSTELNWRDYAQLYVLIVKYYYQVKYIKEGQSGCEKEITAIISTYLFNFPSNKINNS